VTSQDTGTSIVSTWNSKKTPDKLKVGEIKKNYESKREIAITLTKSEPIPKEEKKNLSKSSPNLTFDNLPNKSRLNQSTDSYKSKSKWNFPCYRWIDEHEEIFEGTSFLPQYETSKERSIQRKDELERKRGIYQWKLVDGLPQYIRCTFETLPYDERWNDEKLHDFMSSRMKAGANFGLDKVLGLFHKWKHFDDYADLFNLLPVPKLQKTWRSDEVFARERIHGVNPCSIQRVVEWPIKISRSKPKL